VVLAMISVTNDDDTGVLKWRECGRGKISLSEEIVIETDVNSVDLRVKN
jgi:hypothetical protein